NCEELSKSQIYSYLYDKYKDQTQAQRRNGKMKESNANTNPVPKTGTESSLKQTITVGNNGRQTISNDHDTEELKEPADTPAGYVNSNQQSNLANLQKSDRNPEPKTGTRFVTLTMMAALIVVPLTGISGNFHNIFSYAQTANTTAQTAKQDSLNNTFHS